MKSTYFVIHFKDIYILIHFNNFDMNLWLVQTEDETFTNF